MPSQSLPAPINLYSSSFQQYREPAPQVPDEETASVKSNATHFLEKQAVMPPYQSTSTGKTVKIKPMDKELCFDGSNMPIEKFIRRWEDAGDTDGASSVDLAKQIVPFIKGNDLKEEVEEMSGFEERDWEKLKQQLLNRFGLAQPLVKYTKSDMKELVNSYINKGGVKSLEDFKIFRTKFDSITHYLLRTKHIGDLEEYRDQLLEVLSPELENSVTRELSKDNKMSATIDGGELLPPSATIITYILREVQQASVMKRRQEMRRKDQNITKESAPRKIQPATRIQPATSTPPEDWAKKMEELTKKVEAFTSQKALPPHLSMGPTPAPSAPYREPMKCYYCFQMNHGFNRCSVLSLDEMNGAVKRAGKNFFLPDNSQIPWDPSRSIKQVVDDFVKKVQIAEISSFYGQLEEIDEPSFSIYEADLGKRTRSGKEYEEAPTGKRNRNQQEEVMDVDEEITKIANTPLSSLGPGSQSFQPNSSSKFRFQNPPSENSPTKEKPPKKTYLEKALAKEYPGVEDKIANRILTEQVMSIPVGELLAVSPAVTECIKKKTTNRRVPIEEKSVNSGHLEEKEVKQEESPHYSCALGYVKLNINGENHQALLDTGSMVNVIPAVLAQKLGLVITQKPMKLKGIGGHHTEISGIAESMEICIGQIMKHVHFWVAEGPFQFILGKPFLKDASAKIDYSSSTGERLMIRDSKGQRFLVPITHLRHHKNETIMPANIATRDFCQDQDFSLKTCSVGELLGTSAQLGEGKDTHSDQKFKIFLDRNDSDAWIDGATEAGEWRNKSDGLIDGATGGECGNKLDGWIGGTTEGEWMFGQTVKRTV